ncbi:MFS transporter [Haloglomus halophilum]|uniref:MFS transporter n=1 Tax=Haloglomus halophilum TaxID=2962672 RepID=UPI0020C9D94A|nr:MFS transporter [Haloglomus halophilum]
MFRSGRTQWILLATAAATRFGGGVLMGTAMAVYVGREGSPLAVSAVATAYFAGLMLASPVWGALADVTGRRRAVLVVTGTLATLAAAPLAIADGVWVPVGLRGLYAVFAAGFAPVALTIASERGGADGRGRSLGTFNSARSGGFAGGQFVAGLLLGAVARPELYLVVAGLSALSTVAAAFLVDPTDTGPGTDGDDDAPDDASEPTRTELLREVRHRLFPAAGERGHFRVKGLRWLYVALAVRNVTVLGVMALMAPYLVDVVGVAEPVMGALLAVNHGTQVGAMYLLGVAADRIGRKPLIVAGMAGSGAFAVLAATATVPAAGAGLLGVTGPAWLGTGLARVAAAGGALFVLGVSFSAMTTGAVAFIGDVAPAGRESELMGLRSTAKGLGGVLGPTLVGGIATLAGYPAAFALTSSLAFAAAGLAGLALVESRPAGGRTVPADD